MPFPTRIAAFVLVTVFALVSAPSLHAQTDPKQKKELNKLVFEFQSKKDMLFSPPLAQGTAYWSSGDPTTWKKNVSPWFEQEAVAMEKEIIGQVASMAPKPTIPDEATHEFVKGATFLKEAKSASDYQLAIDAFQKALFQAPWWADAYYNLGIAFESVGRYWDAMGAVKMYLYANPKASQQEKNMLDVIEAKRKMAAKAPAEDEFIKSLDGAIFTNMEGNPSTGAIGWRVEVHGKELTFSYRDEDGWFASRKLTFDGRKIVPSMFHNRYTDQWSPDTSPANLVLSDDGKTITYSNQDYYGSHTNILRREQ